MEILLDTNILVRLTNKLDSQHALARAAVQQLSNRGDGLFIVPQVVYEFWAVVTRPKEGNSNGLGLKPADAEAEVQRFQQAFQFLPDTPDIFPIWLSLVSEHQVSGKNTHDTRIAAAMKVNGLDALLTFNTPDFKRFDLNIIYPKDIS